MAFRLVVPVLLFTAAVSPFTAQAETVTDQGLREGSAAYRWLTSPRIHNTLADIGHDWDQRLHRAGSCHDKPAVHITQLHIIRPLQFPRAGQAPKDGAWQYRFDFRRCRHTAVYNALFVVNAQGGIQAIPLPPGNTYAAVKVMRAALPEVVAAARRRLPACPAQSAADLIGTRVQRGPHTIHIGGKPVHKAIEERWSVRLCGQTVAVPVCLWPDPNHGSRWRASACPD